MVRSAARLESSPVFRPLAGIRSALSTETLDVLLAKDAYVAVQWTSRSLGVLA